MKRSALLIAVIFCCATAATSDSPKRPAIFGIAHVRILATNLQSSLTFFKMLGFDSTEPCIQRGLTCVPIGAKQYVELDPEQTHMPNNYVEEVGFLTADIEAMGKFLRSVGLRPSAIKTNERSSSLSVTDPEGNRIAFVQQQGEMYFLDYDPRASKNLIHAGFVVRDRGAEDKFYKDALGFHVYWHGGMKEGEDHWVDMQVPDGTDWIEYMLNVPADASYKTLGVMNHIALGVPDIHAVEKQLRANGWNGTEEPKIGRDGKWQLNLYDPDNTRIEFMEFTPVQKPCCSEFTGPHPGPQPPSKAPAKP